VGRPEFSRDGKMAVIARAADNKDRWVLLVDTKTGASRVIDQQHDDAWVDGPGSRTLGWLDDDKTLYSQSEKTGWSQLYAANVETGEVKQLTSGRGEVFDADLTPDKKRFRMVTSFDSLASGRSTRWAWKAGRWRA